MQFQIGDRVVHPTYGVVTVKGFSEQRLVGDESHQYYQVATAGLTVWVPLDGGGSTVLRRLATKETLSACRLVLKSRPVRLDRDWRVRQQEIAKRLRGAALPTLSEIVRDLTALSAQQPLGKSEQDLLKKAIKSLADEWAAVEGVTAMTALVEIESLLQAR